jgi:signal transduction histidine kinase
MIQAASQLAKQSNDMPKLSENTASQSASFLAEAESARRLRLVSRFGWLGAFFGSVYALFYFCIGHRWGAVVVVVCSSCFAAAPFWARRKRAVECSAHFLILTLTAGFTALCFVEGGIQGHAIAWLASVPLCALLLLGVNAALGWALAAFAATSAVIALGLMGIGLPVTYDPRWNSLVSAAGYLGLLVFMFVLGLIFETSRKRALAKMEETLGELAAANERLRYLNNEKNEILGIAAHDLKNPLTVIVGCAEMAGMARDQNQIRRLHGQISDAATRMRDLIANLLDVNAIEQGKFSSKIEPCDLGALVAQSVENNQPAASKKGMELRLGAAADLWAKADAAATSQILDNLISNAIKYAPPKTTVHVHATPETDYVLVAVRDEGPGISEADQKKLFQKFSRLSARPTGGESSTGLGLAIVKRLAEAMSGSVQCHSVLGAGATFALRLPVCPAPLRIAPAPVWAQSEALKSQVSQACHAGS